MRDFDERLEDHPGHDAGDEAAARALDDEESYGTLPKPWAEVLARMSPVTRVPDVRWHCAMPPAFEIPDRHATA